MKKALIITNAASMVLLFNEQIIDIFQAAGYQVHIACNFEYGNTVSQNILNEHRKVWQEKGVISHQIGFLRSPFSLKSFEIYRETKALIEKEQFDIIHCHTPIVSVFTRLAGRKVRKKGTKMIYTAHGFHFYKGAPMLNWLIYYTIEKLLAPFTDKLITINQEDFLRASNKFRTKDIYYVSGVGIDTAEIDETKGNRKQLAEEYGLKECDIVILSIGELSERKNHTMVIKAMSMCKNHNLQYFIAGIGKDGEKIMKTAEEFHVQDRVHLLGFRKDVYELLKSSDIFVFPSLQEGLPVALMEAMAASLPVVATNIRGNNDLIDEGKGGYMTSIQDVEGFAWAIDILASDVSIRNDFGKYNKRKAKEYDKKLISARMTEILVGDSPCADTVAKTEKDDLLINCSKAQNKQ